MNKKFKNSIKAILLYILSPFKLNIFWEMFWAVKNILHKSYLKSLYQRYGINEINRYLLTCNNVENVLREFGAKIGKGSRINHHLIIHNAESDYSNLKIGNNCHIGKDVFLDLREKIEIGDNVTISMRATILTHFHVGDSPLKSIYPPQQKSVIIEDGTFIGAGSIILYGCNLGRQSCIGARSVVRHDVPPFTLVAGNPAKPIRSFNQKDFKDNSNNNSKTSVFTESKTVYSKEEFDSVYAERNWEWYRGLLADCIKRGNPGKILDIGAGLGLFVECAQRFGIDCIGIEGSEYAIAEAKKRFPGINMKYHLLEESLPFEDGSFSVVFCYQVLEHLKPQVAKFVLKESRRVLKNGGCFLIFSPSFYNQTERIKESHINLYTPTTLKNELFEAGFTQVKALNSPRLLLGNSKFGIFLMGKFFRVLPIDFLSSTANCLAYK